MGNILQEEEKGEAIGIKYEENHVNIKKMTSWMTSSFNQRYEFFDWYVLCKRDILSTAYLHLFFA